MLALPKTLAARCGDTRALERKRHPERIADRGWEGDLRGGTLEYGWVLESY
jgi:hypothetical protein